MMGCNMNKVVGLKLTDKDKKLIKQIEDSGLSNSELLRKTLEHYFKTVNSVNQIQQEKDKQKVNQVNQTVNHDQQEKQEKTVNQVNQKVNPVQIIENYELLRHYKEEIDWLRNRVEYFEGFYKSLQQDIPSKIDAKKISWFRM